MAKLYQYEVRLTQTVTKTATVIVEAEDFDEAEQLAHEVEESADYTETDWDYRIDGTKELGPVEED